jgi:hypothetical protein
MRQINALPGAVAVVFLFGVFWIAREKFPVPVYQPGVFVFHRMFLIRKIWPILNPGVVFKIGLRTIRD